ncbi:MAG: hypothetical protein WC842_00850 [Candidatus Paceibacterota bacterium]|jgi:hypothetical protein
MKKIILCNIAVTFLVLNFFFYSNKVNAQMINSSSSLESIVKSFLPDPAKEVLDIANDARKKIESKIGIDFEKMTANWALSGINAGSSQKITPESTINLLEQVSGLTSTVNPANTPDFVGRVTDIIRQFIKYIFDIIRNILGMI